MYRFRGTEGFSAVLGQFDDVESEKIGSIIRILFGDRRFSPICIFSFFANISKSKGPRAFLFIFKIAKAKRPHTMHFVSHRPSIKACCHMVVELAAPGRGHPRATVPLCAPFGCQVVLTECTLTHSEDPDNARVWFGDHRPRVPNMVQTRRGLPHIEERSTTKSNGRGLAVCFECFNSASTPTKGG